MKYPPGREDFLESSHPDGPSFSYATSSIQLCAIRVEQIKLYESYADGVLLRDAYIEKKKALSEKLAALQDSIRTEKEEQECADELDEEIRALTKQASEKTYIGGLTKECVDAFVSMVYLYDDQTMKIEFNCEDVIRRALEKYGT